MGKSKPYSTVSVKSVCLDSLLQDRGNQDVWVGIDISKNWLTVALCWGEGDFDRVWKVDYPRELPLLLEGLQRLAAGRRMVIAIEPTGSYGDPLRWAVHRAGLALHRIESKASHDYAEVFDGVPGQNDAKDAMMLGELARHGKGTLWPFLQMSDRQHQIAFWVEQADTLQRVLSVWTGRVEGLLARHWPEASGVLAVTSSTLLRALIEYGSPAGLAEDAQAAAKLRRWGGVGLSEPKVQLLIEQAQHSMGVPASPLEEQRLRSTAQTALEAIHALEKCKRELGQFVAGDEALEAMAPAVGKATACVLYAKLGDPAHYGSARAYLKAAGLNLKERSSGQYLGQLKISKRGPSLPRQWLYLAAVRALEEPSVRRWFDRKRGRDRERSGQACRRKGVGLRALVAIMRRLVIALWTVRTKKRTFDRSRLFGRAAAVATA